MIKLANPGLAVDAEMIEKVTSVLRSGNYILGEETKKLEQEFAAFCGTPFSVAVSSGTTALHLALLALGVKPGDEVITTTHSFVATANAIVHAGGKPVLVDIDPDSHNIDPAKIEACITRKTKGIVPVHIYGFPANMDPILEIAKRRGLFVLEDACQAHGATYRGRKIGTLGEAAAFSFFPSKVMTVCGDGGIVTTRREDVARRIEMLRNQGREKGKKYEHDLIGFNCRLSEVAAAIARQQLKSLPAWLSRRREIAAEYDRALKAPVKTPPRRADIDPAYYVYTVEVPNRDGLREHLKKNGIESGIYYPVPIHLQPAYSGYAFPRFPVAEAVAGRILSLPMHQFLKDEEVRQVAEAVNGFCAASGK